MQKIESSLIDWIVASEESIEHAKKYKLLDNNKIVCSDCYTCMVNKNFEDCFRENKWFPQEETIAKDSKNI